jgi:enterochelin esterase-like enzyme
MDFSPPPPPWATHLVGDPTDWLRAPLPLPLAAPVALPDDARVEYAFLDAHGTVHADPGNPTDAHNPWWPQARALTGPDYEPHFLLRLEDQVPRGELTRHRIDSADFEQPRRVLVYEPARHAGKPLPVIFVQDGVAWHHIGQLDRVLEVLLGMERVIRALLGLQRLRPCRLVFVEPQERAREYRFDEAFARFMIDELVPWVDERYPTSGERMLMGASLGGLVSAWLAWERPDLFSTVIAFSGAFGFGPGDDPAEHYRGTEWLVHQVRAEAPRPIRFILSCGTLEWLTPVNRRLYDALGERGYEVSHEERSGGHNWTTWRDEVPKLLLKALVRV